MSFLKSINLRRSSSSASKDAATTSPPSSPQQSAGAANTKSPATAGSLGFGPAATSVTNKNSILICVFEGKRDGDALKYALMVMPKKTSKLFGHGGAEPNVYFQEPSASSTGGLGRRRSSVATKEDRFGAAIGGVRVGDLNLAALMPMVEEVLRRGLRDVKVETSEAWLRAALYVLRKEELVDKGINVVQLIERIKAWVGELRTRGPDQVVEWRELMTWQ